MRARVVSLLAAVTACDPFTAGRVDTIVGDSGTTTPIADAVGGTAVMPAEIDGGGDGGVLATSCKELHSTRPDLASGIYKVQPRADDAFPVYCDMLTAGGGWTLVARSVKDAGAVTFGWFVSTGTLENDDKPYAITAVRLASFGEILFGARGTAKTWSKPVFSRALPASFLTSFVMSMPTTDTGSTDVTGLCAGMLGKQEPTMLAKVGFTAKTDHYSFSDQPGTSDFGLHPSLWRTNGEFDGVPPGTCHYSGRLTNSEGMIFVR